MSDDLVKRLRDMPNYYNSGGRFVAADRIEELEGKLAQAMLTIEALQGLRPVWAQGWTDDSMAAQASGNALAQLWEMLGVKDQTQAVATLAELKGEQDD